MPFAEALSQFARGQRPFQLGFVSMRDGVLMRFNSFDRVTITPPVVKAVKSFLLLSLTKHERSEGEDRKLLSTISPDKEALPEVHMPHQEIRATGLRAFFERFQSLSSASDVEGLAAMYSEKVMIAGANGVQVVSSADMQRAIPKRKQLLESVGHQETALVGFEETPLTDRYSLVRAQFRWHFTPPTGQQATITLPSTFVVDRGGESPHIVLYLNEHDVVSTLREQGLLARG